MKEERPSMEKAIKTRAPKGDNDWRTVSIPGSIYAELLTVSEKRGESISLIVRKWLSECLKKH